MNRVANVRVIVLVLVLAVLFCRDYIHQQEETWARMF